MQFSWDLVKMGVLASKIPSPLNLGTQIRPRNILRGVAEIDRVSPIYRVGNAEESEDRIDSYFSAGGTGLSASWKSRLSMTRSLH